ncbi:MAG: hypothetical protein R6V58_02725 [Planctomycetota bacterium]
MDGILPLARVRSRIVWNVLRTVRDHSRLKLVSIVVLGGVIWVGLYLFAYYGFHWVVRLLEESSITDLLVSLLFFILMAMLVFSNAVIAYTALFRSKEARFLRSCPVRPWTVFLYKFVESLAFSSWAFVLLGLPIMLAYGMHKLAPWYYYPAMFVFFFSFVLIPASVGSLLAMVLSTLLRPWLRRLLIVAAITLAIGALVAGPYIAGMTRDEENVFKAGALLRRIHFSHSAYWPSAWVSRGLAICAGSPGSGTATDALYYFGLLVSNSLFLCLVAAGFATWTYDRAWNRAQSASSRTRAHRFRFPWPRRRPGGPLWHLLGKDVRTFLRDPVQWTQCGVLFGLLGLYILNLRNMRYPSDLPKWRNLTTFLNLGSICLVLATLTTRFVFPMFSLEGRRFWIVGLMPVKRVSVLWSKFLFAFLASLVITEALMITSDLILAEPLWLTLLHVVTVAMISLGLSGMAVGLSTLYPNLSETSPAKIVSGFGGTLNLILSLIYVFAVVIAEAVPIHLWRIGAISYSALLWSVAGGLALLVVLTAAAFGIPLWLGSRALAKMEF